MKKDKNKAVSVLYGCYYLPLRTISCSYDASAAFQVRSVYNNNNTCNLPSIAGKTVVLVVYDRMIISIQKKKKNIN